MQSSELPDADRRELLRSMGTIPASLLLAGCESLFRRKPVPVCTSSPEVSLPGGPLTIDAHCHVFNGTDLQVKEFFSRVAVRQKGALGFGAQVLGSVLQDLAWTLAPTGDAELTELSRLSSALQTCTDKEHATRIATLLQTGYTSGRSQLQAAVARSSEFRALQQKRSLGTLGSNLDLKTSAQVEAIRLIEELPEDVNAYRSTKENRAARAMALKGLSVQGLIDFVLQNFQYRYVSVHDYLKTYNQPGTRVVDLMLPSMVDYDYWLGMGTPTRTPLRTQVEVMRQMAIITGGRVHGFVPFDPLRQVAFMLEKTSTDSLALVTDAIENMGCVGVKLYPPMGFAVLGNEDVQKKHGPSFWARDWLPGWTNRPDLGVLLDKAMLQMLKWCQDHEVPVMAHTSLSNGVVDDFETLAGSAYWAKALDAYPQLRVSFGHFGDSSPATDGLSKARGFTALMSNDRNARGGNAYADAGYFVEVIGKEPALLANLRQLYEDALPPGQAPLANRFMYGTDWEMTLTEGSIASYLTGFVNLFDDLENRPAMRAKGITGLSNKFFGGNAAEWIGLRKGEAARNRLDAFYKKYNVNPPDWTAKVT